jgi:hypothetical protein
MRSLSAQGGRGDTGDSDGDWAAAVGVSEVGSASTPIKNSCQL